MTFADDAVAALDAVTSALAKGEERPGQRAMCRAVATAISSGRHLVVQGGTGTGKSLAYLVPALLSERPVVIATATKALQDQLADKDLPFLAEHLDHPFDFAVLKGRSNYLCLQRLREATGSDVQLGLDGLDDRPGVEELAAIVEWAATTETGARAELDKEPSPRAWNSVSVGPRECPGASRCPQGEACYTERARAKAASADIIVVNTHLYGLHLATGGGLLPEHDVVVIDEAHQLEETISATAGVDLTGGRFHALSRITAAIVADDDLAADLDAAGDRLATVLADNLGRRLRGNLGAELRDALFDGRRRADAVLSALRGVDDAAGADVAARKQRAMKSATSLIDDIDIITDIPDTDVAWVEGFADNAVLKVAPIDVAALLADSLFEKTTAILTSATIPPGLAEQIGVPEGHDELDAGSPFDYEANALLYCAAHLPDPRSATYEAEMHRELEALVVAAGGRTLALFTSYRAMQAAADALRPRIPWELATQNDAPKPALIRRFTEDETSCLFATMSFWQGVDIPGPALSLVTIDRLPFPRPDEPLLQARRERARGDAFRVVDLPRASTLLAQGAGRLIRRSDDRGVVAVLDPRLATNARYRWDIVRSLPPMRRTRSRSDAEALLRQIRETRSAALDRPASQPATASTPAAAGVDPVSS
jgi:ATP-dependent DNA helicase DinG